MAGCFLCLKVDLETKNCIGLYSSEGKKLKIAEIISQHFWLQPVLNKGGAFQHVCMLCWNAVRIFHEFYDHVAEIHNSGKFATARMCVQINDDPLPTGYSLTKPEDVDNPMHLAEALNDDFYDYERVKMEVMELNLLPQDNVETEKRECRWQQKQQTNEGNNSEDPDALSKKIFFKEENDPFSSGDTLNVQPMDVHNNKICIDNSNFNTLKRSPFTESNDVEVPRKLRRSTRNTKQKDLEPTNPKEKAKTTKKSITKIEKPVASSPEPADFGVDVDDEDGDGDNFIPNDDYESSKSESEDSLPDFEPKEEFTIVPKKVVIKPKKYRKRPKPEVPPRRMTREEIDQRNALREKYDKIIAQFYDKFTCAKCDVLVKNFVDLKRHFRLSHNIDPGYVVCCGRKFNLRKTLADHVHVHWNPEHFKCTTCARIFQDSYSLEKHGLEHSDAVPPPKPKRIFQCEKCPKTFTTKNAHEDHCATKHVPKSEYKFTCTICNKKFPTERKFKDHVKCMHDPESAVICDKCGKQVRSQSYLKRHHELEHSDIPRAVPIPVQCEICGTWLRHMAGLKQHMKSIHEESQQEHRCQICNKVSTNERALKRHIYLNHQCERKFKCTMCEKAFKRRQDLREHTSVHTGEVLYTCPNCPMTFFSNANMYKHRQRLHRAEYEAGRKKARPPNIMQQAINATAASLQVAKKNRFSVDYN